MPVLPRHALPFAPKGATIGLFGGSFDPAHEGHVQLTHHSLRHLQLDQLWWLVSPGNPLKAHGPAPLPVRLARASQLMQHPKVQITPIEAALGTRYTADTLRAILRLYPGRRFVWIMGADNLASFHHWENWREIMQRVPIAVVARPGVQLRALSSVAARSFPRARLPARDGARLGKLSAPAWCFLTIPLQDISSSRLRAQGVWVR
ncbi:MAG: nicotinate-nucleotide adenylyltransferase [Roseinatronobacter sp.]|nr:nicotinate-nucleotide adenylyltransferase [Roseinatronobacter sp.]